MTIDQARERLADIETRLRLGCGNHGCVIRLPFKFGTNSTCKCRPKDFARDLQRLASELHIMREWPKGEE